MALSLEILIDFSDKKSNKQVKYCLISVTSPNRNKHQHKVSKFADLTEYERELSIFF